MFGYVEHQENIDFREAVELLADKYHIELHYENSGGRTEHSGSKWARLIEANEEAQRFFMSQIMSKEALAARKLLGGRNFSRADCERFGCGYAPQGWDNWFAILRPRGSRSRRCLTPGLRGRGSAACTTISAAAPHGRFVILDRAHARLWRAQAV